MSEIEGLLRKHLKDFTPYSTARDDFKGNKGIFLDANENALGSVISEKWNRSSKSFVLWVGRPPAARFLKNGVTF